MTVLVLGATGFIGARLVRRLGEDAVAASRRPTPSGRLADWEGRWIHVDPADVAALTSILRRVTPRVVVHAAVGRDPDLHALRATETAMADAVCAAVLEAGVPQLVVFGSAAEYGNHTPPLHERLAPRPRTRHGRVKAASVRQVLQWSRDVPTSIVVLRPFHVTGPGEPLKKLLPRAIAAAHGGSPLPIVPGDPVRDLVGVDDVVRGILAAIEHPPADGLPVNLCSGQASRVRDIVAAVEQAVGVSVPVVGTHPRSGFDAERRIGDSSRAAALWGWQASSLQEIVCGAVEAWPWRNS